MAFHPQFATNRRFFVSYTANRPTFSNVIAEYRAQSPEEKVLLTIPKPYQNHNGGFLLFGPDGYLYMATGDGGGGGDPLQAGQDLQTLLGKMLRIDVDSAQSPYGIPSDNPLVGQAGKPEIYAWGLRNVWRFSFDRQTKALFAGDVGQNRLEEIDIIVKGGNYGWNTMEGSLCFSPAVGCETKGLIPPIWEYPREQGISVTGGYVYRGQRIPELQGVYVYGDFGSGRIWGLKYNQELGQVEGNELLLESQLPIASFGEDPDGELFVVAYHGIIYSVVP